MSGFIVYPPSTDSNVFNPSFYQSSTNTSTALIGIVNGTAAANKAIVLDSNKSVTGLGAVDCTSLSISGVSPNLSSISGITLGTPAANKVLSLDATSQLNGNLNVQGSVDSNLIFRTTRTTSGHSFSSVNGTSTCALYHYNNADAYFGTTSSNGVVFQTSNVGRVFISASAAFVGITSSSPICSIDLGATAGDRKISLFSTSGGTNSFYGFGANSGQLRYQSENAHAWFTASTQTLVGTQIMSLGSNGLLTVPAVSILADTTAGATSSTILRWGDVTETAAQWYINYFRGSIGYNSHFTLFNQLTGAAGLRGINIGGFDPSGNADGAMVILNGFNGDGSFISCGTSSTNGALHINAGISQSIPSGWELKPTGTASFSAGTVPVSLYCHQHIWVRGSVFSTSDVRLKEDIVPIDESKIMNLLNVKPVWYKWKGEDSQHQLGLIAQDLLRNDLKELVSLFSNDRVEESDDEFDIPAGKQLVVSYDRIPLYLLAIIKKLNSRVEKLEQDRIQDRNLIEQLVARPVVQKWLSKTYPDAS